MGTRTVSSTKSHSHALNPAGSLAPWRGRLNRLAWICLAILAVATAIILRDGILIAASFAVVISLIAMAMVRHTPRRPGGNIMVVGQGAQASALTAALSIEPLQPARLANRILKDLSSEPVSDVIHVPTLDEATAMLPHLPCDRIVLVGVMGTDRAIPPDVRGVAPNIVASGAELQRILGRVPVETLKFDDPARYRRRPGLPYAVVKRALDLVIAIPLALIVAALVPVLMLAIRLDSPGPLFYSQTRLGRDGRRFRIHKFRTMRQDAEANGAAWATTDDPRVTRLGRILRSTRIDELPQVWNILRGHMTLIGPRPERPELAALIEEHLPEFSLRTGVTPGITGWAQICAGYGRSVHDARTKLEYDLFYLAHASLLFDLKILLNTVPVVIGRKGS